MGGFNWGTKPSNTKTVLLLLFILFKVNSNRCSGETISPFKAISITSLQINIYDVKINQSNILTWILIFPVISWVRLHLNYKPNQRNKQQNTFSNLTQIVFVSFLRYLRDFCLHPSTMEVNGILFVVLRVLQTTIKAVCIAKHHFWVN